MNTFYSSTSYLIDSKNHKNIEAAFIQKYWRRDSVKYVQENIDLGFRLLMTITHEGIVSFSWLRNDPKVFWTAIQISLKQYVDLYLKHRSLK